MEKPRCLTVQDSTLSNLDSECCCGMAAEQPTLEVSERATDAVPVLSKISPCQVFSPRAFVLLPPKLLSQVICTSVSTCNLQHSSQLRAPDRFGKGVYFADASTKSLGYTHYHLSDQTGLLLLCEVATAPLLELQDADYNAADKCKTANAL